MTGINGTKAVSKLLMPPRARNGELMARTAKLPPLYTNAGLAQVTMPDGTQQMTVMAVGAGLDPMVFDPNRREWQRLHAS